MQGALDPQHAARLAAVLQQRGGGRQTRPQQQPALRGWTGAAVSSPATLSGLSDIPHGEEDQSERTATPPPRRATMSPSRPPLRALTHETACPCCAHRFRAVVSPEAVCDLFLELAGMINSPAFAQLLARGRERAAAAPSPPAAREDPPSPPPEPAAAAAPAGSPPGVGRLSPVVGPVPSRRPPRTVLLSPPPSLAESREARRRVALAQRWRSRGGDVAAPPATAPPAADVPAPAPPDVHLPQAADSPPPAAPEARLPPAADVPAPAAPEVCAEAVVATLLRHGTVEQPARAHPSAPPPLQEPAAAPPRGMAEQPALAHAQSALLPQEPAGTRSARPERRRAPAPAAAPTPPAKHADPLADDGPLWPR
eukprot:TRINITY_DN16643_c0_g1_i1.p2 TRINITY_DN16643_c0_g1~~TRINITY_DN16643_c0_g1_i1.p2  ORF type:complete len:398 (+),score=126.57 TRINITY_DN16643_c0_g1_i1:91-1194(+)